LDKEGRVPQINDRLVKTHSKYHPSRTVTKEEYIYIWNKNIEFDNFSYAEIAQAMTKIGNNEYIFEAKDIEVCEKRLDAKEGNPLGKLFREKLGYDMAKPKLLEILFNFIISDSENEFDSDGKAKRPGVQLMQKIVGLATRNYQPARLATWQKNQESGFLGDSIEHKSEIDAKISL
jgi:hypothetical protein